MSASGAFSPDWLLKREDFPQKTMQYVETKLAVVRKLLMATAARTAAVESAASPSYRVEFRHVDQAVQELIGDLAARANDLEPTA